MAEWLTTLDAKTRARAESCIRVFQELGDAREVAEGVVQADLEGESPEVAITLLLDSLWTGIIDPQRDNLPWIERQIKEAEKDPTGYFADAGLALKRMVAAGVDPQDIGSVARLVAYESVFNTVDELDAGCHQEVVARLEDADRARLPGWALVEIDPETEEPTGRKLTCLHESLLSADPSGREGRPG